jgi:hypothetical protein
MDSMAGGEEGNKSEGESPSQVSGEQIKEGKDAEVRQSVYEALEAKGQYAGQRSLHAPDGKFNKVTYSIPKSSVRSHTARAHAHHMAGGKFGQGGHQRRASHTAHAPHHTPVHWSDTPYAKGEQRRFWDWLKWKLGW